MFNSSSNSKNSAPFVEYQEPGKWGTQLREPTEAELAASTTLAGKLVLLRLQRDQLIQQVKDLEASCEHTVCVDYPGLPYDRRVCAACGASRGLV